MSLSFFRDRQEQERRDPRQPQTSQVVYAASRGDSVPREVQSKADVGFNDVVEMLPVATKG